MRTQCNVEQLGFGGVGRRRVVAAFDGGQVGSDAGALLLERTDQVIRLIDRLAGSFVDRRLESAVEHSVRTLVAQRVLGIAAGYEDLNDHDIPAPLECPNRGATMRIIALIDNADVPGSRPSAPRTEHSHPAAAVPADTLFRRSITPAGEQPLCS